MDKMLVSAFSINGVATVEIKHNDHYTIISGRVKKSPIYLLLKAVLIALWEEHICAEGWEDKFGFHYGKQPQPKLFYSLN